MAIVNQTLEQILSKVNGASFISIDTLTEVKLKGGKKNPHQGRVTKLHAGAQVMVFQNKNSNAYENMVERRLIAEGKDPKGFELGPRTWGTRIPNTPFIEHNGTRYLEVIFLRSGQVDLMVDGQMYDAEKHGVIEGLDDDREPTGQGGLENQVIIRTFKESSIKQVRVNKQEYIPLV